MTYDAAIHHRRSIRLPGYDYSRPGAYFITITAFESRCAFGSIVAGQMLVNARGRVAAECWEEIPQHYPNVRNLAFVVMPNHVHGIQGISIEGRGMACHARTGLACQTPTAVPFARSAGSEPPRPAVIRNFGHYNRRSISVVVGSYKSAVARRVHAAEGKLDDPVWHRNYFEHVVRDQTDLDRIRQYILTNPTRWHLDRQNPDREGEDEFDRWLSEFPAL